MVENVEGEFLQGESKYLLLWGQMDAEEEAMKMSLEHLLTGKSCLAMDDISQPALCLWWDL